MRRWGGNFFAPPLRFRDISVTRWANRFKFGIPSEKYWCHISARGSSWWNDVTVTLQSQTMARWGRSPIYRDTRGFADLSQMVLIAYQTTQNCPLITNMATFFRYHVQFSRYKSLKSELWNNHWKPGCGSRKVSTNRCSKTPTIDILKCY